jgi:threonine synthase
MRATIGFLSFFATKRNRRITLLVSTTGDTGPAAVQAVADMGNPLLTILVHYPEGQISAFQRKQMTCIDSEVVVVAAFQGGGDDMDLPIKNMLRQQDNVNSGRYLTGVNSYNFSRPMAQIVHHVG